VADGSQKDPQGPPSQGQTTVITHFYRGELGRMVMWRDRLDRTTNWAIIAATAIVSYAWSHDEFTHIGFLLGNAILYILLMIEGRRYLFFDAYRGRVRMLEANWIAPHLIGEAIHEDWRQMLRQDLAKPSHKITIWEALGNRLFRNYIWLYLIVAIGWVLKVWMKGIPVDLSNPGGIAMAVLLGCFYLYLGVLLFLAFRMHEASGRFRKHHDDPSNPWSI